MENRVLRPWAIPCIALLIFIGTPAYGLFVGGSEYYALNSLATNIPDFAPFLRLWAHGLWLTFGVFTTLRTLHLLCRLYRLENRPSRWLASFFAALANDGQWRLYMAIIVLAWPIALVVAVFLAVAIALTEGYYAYLKPSLLWLFTAPPRVASEF